METSYLEYYKLILDKVRFDKNLWEKELKKALKSLDSQQAEELKRWAGDYRNGSPLHRGRNIQKAHPIG